jgi:hypothetical protein
MLPNRSLKTSSEGVIVITPELNRSECLTVAQKPGHSNASSMFLTTTVSASKNITANWFLSIMLANLDVQSSVLLYCNKQANSL